MTMNKPSLTFTTTLPAPSNQLPNFSDGPIQNFTATGRPFDPSKASHGSGLASLGSTDAMCLDAPDNLPRRYTDSSLICIPVLPPSTVEVDGVRSPTSPVISPVYSLSGWSDGTPTTSTGTITEESGNPVRCDATTRRPSFKFWKSRDPSSSTATPTPVSTSTLRGKRAKRSKNDFVMKQITRGEYLKHYAKDEQGRYVGSEEPAGDCILRDEGDLKRWRGGRLQGVWEQ